MTDKLMAPKLPKGYKFNLSVDDNGDLMICIQRRGWMLWLIPYWATVDVRPIYRTDKVDSLPALVEANMVAMAGKLIFDLKAIEYAKSADDVFMVAVSKMLGDYPPKKYLMED